MKRAGRVSWILVAVFLGLIAFGAVIFFSSGDTPEAAGGKFMAALINGDADTLTKYSYMEGLSQEQIRERWEYTLHRAAPHYRFVYSIDGSTRTGDETAAIKLTFTKNVGQKGSVPDNFQLPLVKQDKQWKVDVRSMNRDMFPGLPR